MKQKLIKAQNDGKRIALDELKNKIVHDIVTLEDALKICGRNVQLEHHVDKLKDFANKYFYCSFTTHDDDYSSICIADLRRGFEKASVLKPFNTVEKTEKADNTAENKTTEIVSKDDKNENDTKETKKDSPKTHGKGWHKEFVDGKTKIVFHDTRKQTHDSIEGLDTGVLHTYESLVNADDPAEYLDNIKIGDKIQFAKGLSPKKIALVSSIYVNKKAFAPNRHTFYMRGGDSICYKDFV